MRAENSREARGEALRDRLSAAGRRLFEERALSAAPRFLPADPLVHQENGGLIHLLSSSCPDLIRASMPLRLSKWKRYWNGFSGPAPPRGGGFFCVPPKPTTTAP